MLGRKKNKILDQRLRQLFQETTEDDTCPGLPTESGGDQGPPLRIDSQDFPLSDKLIVQFGTAQLQDTDLILARGKVKVVDGKRL